MRFVLGVAAVFGLGGALLSLRHHRDANAPLFGSGRSHHECHRPVCRNFTLARFSRRHWLLAARC